MWNRRVPFVRLPWVFLLVLVSVLDLPGAWGANAKSFRRSDRAMVALTNAKNVSENAFPSAPLVLFTDPAENSFITTANYENFRMSGFCSENGQLVRVGGVVNGSSPCIANSWTIEFDLSFIFDGTLTFTAHHSAIDASYSPIATRTFLKDTIAPFQNSIGFVDPAPLTVDVDLALRSQGATRVFLTNSPDCVSNGTFFDFASTIRWTLEPIGRLATVYAKFLDAAGNQSSCLSASIEIELPSAPVALAISSPLPGAFVNLAQAASVRVSGSCSENGRPVTLASPNLETSCANFVWATEVDLQGASDGLVSLVFSHGNAAGSFASATIELSKDTVPPTVVLEPFPRGGYANIENHAAFVLGGSCSEEGRAVTLAAIRPPLAPFALPAVPCLAKRWTLDANLSALPDGVYSVQASQSDAHANVGYSELLPLTKDTVPPVVVSWTINQSAAVTNQLLASLSLVATEAATAQTYPNSVCEGAAPIVPYASESNLLLVPAGTIAHASVRVRDLAGNVSGCTTDSILYDILPALVSIDSPSVAIHAKNAATFSVSGTCSEEGRAVTLSGMVGASVVCASGRWSHTSDLRALPDGTPSLFADHIDAAGNAARQASAVFTKDTVGPEGSIVIAGGANFTTASEVALSLSSADAATMLLTHSPTCDLGGAWEPYSPAKIWELAQKNQIATLYASFKDAAGNVGECASDSILHDDLPPAPPVLAKVVPVSPANSVSPTIFGQAPSPDTVLVALYPDSSCLGTVLGAASPPDFGTLGISVSVAANTTTPIFGRTTDTVGLSSLCVLLTEYSHEPPPLVISPALLSLSSTVPQTSVFSAAGGTPPYRFSIMSGEGTIEPESGKYEVAAGVAGETVVRLQDAAGKTAEARVVHTRSTNLVLNGPVRAIVVDSAGNTYIGGSFTQVNGLPRRALVKLGADGVVDETFLAGDSLNGDVYALALGPNLVFAGGTFTTVNGNAANRIVKLSVAGGVDATFSPLAGPNGFDKPVAALAYSNGFLYAGGEFNRYRGAWANGLAKISENGILDSGFSGKDGTNGRVHSLAILGEDSLLAGGIFNLFKKLDAHRIAKLSVVGGILDPIFSPQPGAIGRTNGTNNDVLAIAVDPRSGKIYLGGRFNRYRGATAESLLRLNPDGSPDAAFLAKPAGEVRALALSADGSRIYAGGVFTSVNDRSVGHLAAFDSTGGLDPGFQAGEVAGIGPSTASVDAITIDGNRLSVGGSFTQYRMQPAEYWIRVDATTGEPE